MKLRHMIYPLSREAGCVLTLLAVGRGGKLSTSITASPDGFTIRIGRRLVGKGTTINEAWDQMKIWIKKQKQLRQSARAARKEPVS